MNIYKEIVLSFMVVLIITIFTISSISLFYMLFTFNVHFLIGVLIFSAYFYVIGNFIIIIIDKCCIGIKEAQDEAKGVK